MRSSKVTVSTENAFTVTTSTKPCAPNRTWTQRHQSYGLITSFPRTSVAKLLCTPAFQFGTSNVDVWHHGFSVSSFSITRAKCSDQPLRGNFAVVVSIRRGWTRFARLQDPACISYGMSRKS